MRPLLRLVHSKNPGAADHFEPVQGSLALGDANCLFVSTSEALDQESFTDLLVGSSVAVVLDFRTSPRFDFGTLNRKRVFSLFDRLGTRYLDLGAAELNTLHSPELSATLTAMGASPKGGVTALVLTDSRSDYRDLGLRLAGAFRTLTERSWVVVLQGPEETVVHDQPRDVLFISHANPEDNDFALWLNAQLSRNGYRTWCDLRDLRGGDVFWDEIEDVLRHRAAKVIAITSRAATGKPGVQDEISVAVSIERATGQRGFVLPVRVDDLPFAEFRANLHRRHSVDFSDSWSKGLTSLIDALRRENIPRRSSEEIGLNTWWEQQRPARPRLSNKSETLLSNEFAVTSLPERLFVLRGGSAAIAASHPDAPLVAFEGGWLSIATPQELAVLAVTGLQHVSTISFPETLRGEAGPTRHLAHGARRALFARLLNKTLYRFFSSRGLRRMDGAGSPTFYVPLGLVDKNQVQIIDVGGILRKRLLVGHSDKRKVNWHLGCQAQLRLDEEPRMQLRLRVLFTDDTTEEPVPLDRAAELRRRFCKNWWNDRWRTLQTAFIACMSSDGALLVWTGASGILGLCATPIAYEAAVGIDETVAVEVEDGSNDVEMNLDVVAGDWLDEGFEDDVESQVEGSSSAED